MEKRTFKKGKTKVAGFSSSRSDGKEKKKGPASKADGGAFS